MARTPQQRSDESDDKDLGATPDAPQGRTDQAQDTDDERIGPPASTDGGDDDPLQPPVTRDEVARRDLDDEAPHGG